MKKTGKICERQIGHWKVEIHYVINQPTGYLYRLDENNETPYKSTYCYDMYGIFAGPAYWFKSLRERIAIVERDLFTYAAELDKQEFIKQIDQI